MTDDQSESSESTEGQTLSFTDHLQELRVRLIICIAWFAVMFMVGFYFAPSIVGFLMQPLINLPRDQEHGIMTLYLERSGKVHGWAIASPDDTATTMTPTASPTDTAPTTKSLANIAQDSIRIVIDGIPEPIEIGPKTQARLSYLTPMEPFFLWIQGALLLSSVLTIPMFVYQFWLFISPGLLKRERGVVGPLLAASILLFPLGAGFAYLIAQVVLKALLAFGDSIEFLEPNLVASSYVKFILVMMFMFGLVFEFPLVLLLLSRLGIVNSEKLIKRRRMAIVVMAIIAAVATPTPDPFTMILMLIPLLLLYEGSIATIRLLERRDRANEARESEINS